MKFLYSLSFKIIVVLILTLLATMIGTTYFHMNAQSDHMEETILSCAKRASHFVHQALLHGMQENMQEDIWKTITDLSNTPDVENIRIYDQRGIIRYSTNSNEIWEVADKCRGICGDCHNSNSESLSGLDMRSMHIFNADDGHRIMELITPIENQKSCWEAPCHAHEESVEVLGVLTVDMSLEHIDKQLLESEYIVVYSSLITMFLLALSTGIFVFIFVHKPVRKVIAGTRVLGSGDLSHRIPSNSKDELGELANEINEMADDLQHAKAELLNWSNTLEEKVEKKSRQLNQVQAQILQMEKMASLGKLSSSIAHELNNPLAGILTYAKLTCKRIESGTNDPKKIEGMISDLRLIAGEAKRCGDIVKNLLFFARAHSGEYARVDLKEVIEKSLRLVQHQIDLGQISLKMNLPPDPVYATCDQGQMQQCVLALFINAIEAMGDEGILGIDLHTDDTSVRIIIGDNGSGISAEDQHHIFEPFFTTKDVGRGTGLGLSITYGIIKNHAGDIKVESAPGKGSVFTITIPVAGPEALSENAV